jgi:hypothetical protein
MRFARTIYMVLLVLNSVFALVLGLNSLLDFEGAMKSFNITYNETMAPLGTISGSQFLLQGAMLLLAASWTSRRNSAGVWVGVAVGAYLVFLTVVEVAYGRGQLALIADAPRGALLFLFGLIVWRLPAKVTEGLASPSEARFG